MGINSQVRVAVCSPSFSKNQQLVEELLADFPDSKINSAGVNLAGQSLVAYLKSYKIAIIGREVIDESTIKALPQLSFVAKYGVGMDNLDPELLRQYDIGLGFTAGVNKASVAELTLFFLLGLFHNSLFTGLQLKQGNWNKSGGFNLSNKTVGIVGCGNIGSELIRILQPFDCKILINDILDKSQIVSYWKQAGVEIMQVDLVELTKSSDAISLHVPLTDVTNRMVNQNFFDGMRKDSFIINTSRGEVIETDALVLALQSGKLAGAALDVFDIEPPQNQSLTGLPNLYGTPHIGGNSRESVLAMGRSALQSIKNYVISSEY